MTSASGSVVKMVVLWLFLGGYTAFLVQNCGPEKPYFTEGRTLLHKGKFKEAEKKFERYLRAYPAGIHKVRARFLLAKSHLGAGSLDKAAIEFQKVRDDHSASSEAKKSIFKLAIVNLIQGNKAKASELSSRIISIEKGSLCGEATALNHWLAGGRVSTDKLLNASLSRLSPSSRGGSLVKKCRFKLALPYLWKSGSKEQLFRGKAYLGLNNYPMAYATWKRCGSKSRKNETVDKCAFKAAMALVFLQHDTSGRYRGASKPKQNDINQLLNGKIPTGLDPQALLGNPAESQESYAARARTELAAIKSGVMLPEATAVLRWLGD